MLAASRGRISLQGWTFQLNPAKMIQRVRETAGQVFLPFALRDETRHSLRMANSLRV